MDPITEQKCPACGAPLRFDPPTGKLVCDWCGTVLEIEPAKAEAGNAAARKSAPDALPIYNCESCGAEIIAPPENAAMTCPYCGNNIVLTEQVAGDLRPDGVIPFAIPADKVPAAVRRFYRGKVLAPRGFFSDAALQNVRGVYVPFFLYSGTSQGNFVFRGYRQRTYRRGDYLVTERRAFQLDREISMVFRGVPADAGAKMDDALMDSLEPYDPAGIKPFDIRYLSGFLADRFDKTSDEVRGRADQRMKHTLAAAAAARTTGGYAGVVCGSDRGVQTANTDTQYVLLPVYTFSLSWKGKEYSFAMNGQTGKVVGTVPTDKKASARWFWLSFAAAAGTLFLLFALGLLL